MRVIAEPLDGVKLIELTPHVDSRGSFTETYNRAKLAAIGINEDFRQDNQSLSHAIGTVRGIHLQLAPQAQGKLVRVLSGAAVDVAVDLRPNSPTFRQHCAVELRGSDDLSLWIPTGFGHAFCTTEPETVLAYKCTALWNRDAERTVRWDDATLAIPWPVTAGDATLSEKDATAPSLAELEGDLR